MIIFNVSRRNTEKEERSKTRALKKVYENGWKRKNRKTRLERKEERRKEEKERERETEKMR